MRAINRVPVHETSGLCSGQLLMMWSAVCSGSPHMPHCPPVPTSPLLSCSGRPQFAVCLESSSVFDSDLLPGRLVLGPICGDVLGWVRVPLLFQDATIHASLDRFPVTLVTYNKSIMWGLKDSSVCECGAPEQTVDHILDVCPQHRPPSGRDGIVSLDEDTRAWLASTGLEI